MKHLLIALGLMSSHKCACDKHFNNPSLISGYSYGYTSRKRTKEQIRKSMNLADDIPLSASSSLYNRDTFRISNLR